MSKPRIEVYEDDAGEWRWSLVAANNEIVASGESHPSRAGAVEAAETAARVMGEATE